VPSGVVSVLLYELLTALVLLFVEVKAGALGFGAGITYFGTTDLGTV